MSVLHLFGVGGHEVETTGGDVEVDGHASKLQVALSQDGRQRFGRRLRKKQQQSRAHRVL